MQPRIAPFALLLAIAFGILVAVSGQPSNVQAAPASSHAPKLVEVFANRGWQPTGVRVTPGDHITIEYVAGLWYPDNGVWHDASGGPNPWTCRDPACHEPLHDFPKYALIGAIRNNKGLTTILRVGNRLEFTATAPGTLYLRGNYGDVDLPIFNPPGSVIVRISGY